MLLFSIYNTGDFDVSEIKKAINEYANEQYTVIQTIAVDNIPDLIKLKSKICLMDYDFYIEHLEEFKDWKNKNKVNFICVANGYIEMIEAVRKDNRNFYLLKPVKTEMLVLLFNYIREKIRSDIIAVKLGHNGEEVIEIKKLNYINIANRNLRFYMSCGREIDSQALRQSFAKETKPMLIHPELYFLPPSLIFNLENIKQLHDDHMVFKSGQTAYFPRAGYQKLRKAWKEFHGIEEDE